MSLASMNERLTLLAHFGVLAGLIVLIMEINQANRIATYSAENLRRTQNMEMNSQAFENPEIIVKLRIRNSELNEAEYVQALFMARQQMNTWVDAEAAYLNGLLSEKTYAEVFRDIDVVVDEMPGLVPSFRYVIEAYGSAEMGLATIDHLIEALDREVAAANDASVKDVQVEDCDRVGLMTVSASHSVSPWPIRTPDLPAIG
jgi:hypothetical protein